MLIDLADVAQHWSDRRASWRPRHEPFDPSQFAVGPINRISDTRQFIETHHYSRSFPVALVCYGLIERTGRHARSLAGVAVFSVPIQAKAAAAYGAGSIASCDLGRFPILDHVGSNAETWFLARCLRLLMTTPASGKTPPPRLVIAYSDPLPRTDAKGTLCFAGHFGGIYRDSAALYLGRSSPRSLWLCADGSSLSDRMLSKLRTGDRGAGYGYGQLFHHGAPPRHPGENDAAYVTRALREGPFRRIRHAGNHVYAFPLGPAPQRQRLRQRLERDLPRPTHTDPPPAG